MPEHLVTADNFYKQVKDHLKDNGIVAMNFIASPSFSTPFSRNLDNSAQRIPARIAPCNHGELQSLERQ
jgi:spermidine synthase